jgi:hypothetical protein
MALRDTPSISVKGRAEDVHAIPAESLELHLLRLENERLKKLVIELSKIVLRNVVEREQHKTQA